MKRCCVALLFLGLATAVLSQELNPERSTVDQPSGIERAEALLATAKEELRKNPERALQHSSEAADIATELGDERLLAVARSQTGLAHCDLGQFPKAIADLDSAVFLFRRLDDQIELAKALHGQATVYERTGAFERSVERSLEALSIYDTIGDEAPLDQRASCLSSLGVVNYRLGQAETALGYFNRALRLQEEAGDTRGISNSLNSIGVILKSQGQFEESLDCYKRALAGRRELGESRALADTLSNIGVVHFEMGNHAAALNDFLEAMDLREAIGDQFGLAQILANIGELYRHMGRLERSVEYLSRSARIGKEIGARDLEQYVWLELARTHEAQEDFAEALECYKVYVEMRDEFHAARVNERIAELQTQFEVERHENEIALLRQDRRMNALIRNSLVVASVLLAVIAALAFRSLSLKKRSARLIRKKNEELESVDRIVRLINQQQDFESLLATLLDQALATLPGAELASFLVLNQATRKYQVVASRRTEGEQYLRADLGFADAHLRYFKNSEEIQPDIFIIRQPRGRAGEEELDRIGVVPKSMLVLAVRLDGQVEGILVLDNFSSHDAFEDQDVNFLLRLKEHVHSAYVKTRMLNDFRDLSDAKSEVLRIAAHDIRSPLVSIIAGLKTLVLRLTKGKTDSLSAIEKLESLIAVGTQGLELLERLLDLSLIESGAEEPRLENVDLQTVLHDCVDQHRPAASSKEISIEMECSRGLPTVQADRLRLIEVVNNLVSNAVKYTHPGGWVRLCCEANEAEVVVRVEDCGQGLGAEDLKLVFRSFRRLSAKPTGGETSRGIGLAIAKTIIERHDGRIWVDSERGRGSTFSFSLPLTESRAVS